MDGKSYHTTQLKYRKNDKSIDTRSYTTWLCN